jgi:peptide/nickel transport system substrate-binding protein
MAERIARTCAGLALALVCIGCRGAVERPVGTIQVDIESSPTATDPRFSTDAISSRINELVFEGMVRIGRDGGFENQLAESVERPAPDTVVFHLRRGLRFSDGRSFGARDVVYTYNSMLDPRSHSGKRAGFAYLKSIEAFDAVTVIMTTKGPFAPALEMASLGIVPFGTPLPARATGVAPPGIGPFRMTGFSRDESVILERSATDANRPGGVARITFKIVPDPTVRALELAEGVCDLSENNVDPEMIGWLDSQPAVHVKLAPGTTFRYMFFNFRNPALRDVRVRRAFAYAIDRRAMANSMLRRTARVANGVLTPENWAYSGAVAEYHYDPARARELLDDAGYRADSRGRRDLRFVFKTTPQGARLAQAIQAMLKQVGVEVEIRSNEWSTFYSDIQAGNFDLAAKNWVGISDPNHFQMIFDSHMTPPAGANHGAYSNPAMDALLARGAITLDINERKRIYAGVQAIAADDLPYLPLWWDDTIVARAERLAGFEAYPNGSLRSLATLSISMSIRGAGAAAQ